MADPYFRVDSANPLQAKAGQTYPVNVTLMNRPAPEDSSKNFDKWLKIEGTNGVETKYIQLLLSH